MHSLVHPATRGWLKKQDRERRVSNDAICHLAARFPAINDAHYGLRKEYLLHAMCLLNRNQEDRTVEVYQLYEKVGHSFDADRRFKEAIRCFEEVYRWRQGRHPEKDHSRLISEPELASAYLGDRRIKDAIEILEHVVAIKAEILPEGDFSQQLSINLLKDCVKVQRG
uniref:WGS project CBMI000000000 data, contig CS3069_c001277 n=1 Tax=Fusarium clavum TaxID=2594811 RepID=A0A090MBH6_9HYPO|nr:unnamed protein product [Fusarium clavum]CEG05766.1 unnamed protein product [Fusarium clavum]